MDHFGRKNIFLMLFDRLYCPKMRRDVHSL
jgi:hypothetical protein